MKMPSEMTISEFSSDDYRFTMTVDVLDKNTAIGIIETLRTFDTVSGIIVDSLQEVDEELKPEDFELIKGTYLVIDETQDGAKAAVQNGDEVIDENEEVAVITTNENEEGDTALNVKKIGTYYHRIDPETEEEIYVRHYVRFTVSCVYTPAEEIVIENNVNVSGEGN